MLKLISYFLRLIEEEDNCSLYNTVSKDELLPIISSFKKYKSLRLDGWTAEFFEDLFDIMGDDLLWVVQKVRQSNKMLSSINSMFIAVIPKVNCPSSFDDFKPMALCNCLYKSIAKVIVIRLKPMLSKIITFEQFDLLKEKLVHEAIGSTREGLHSIKNQRRPLSIIKLDLSKAYDHISWFYLKVLLLHLGFDLPLVKWIISCVASVSFVVLIGFELVFV